MRILTLTQPWASLVAIGAKRVETRSWSTAYRGELGIHASKKFPREARALCETEPFRSVLARRFASIDELPLGKLLAIARLQACVPTDSVLGWADPVERAFGDYSAGRFAHVLGAPPPFPMPEQIDCRGALGLWRPGGELLERLSAMGLA